MVICTRICKYEMMRLSVYVCVVLWWMWDEEGRRRNEVHNLLQKSSWPVSPLGAVRRGFILIYSFDIVRKYTYFICFLHLYISILILQYRMLCINKRCDVSLLAIYLTCYLHWRHDPLDTAPVVSEWRIHLALVLCDLEGRRVQMLWQFCTKYRSMLHWAFCYYSARNLVFCNELGIFLIYNVLFYQLNLTM